MDIDGFPLSAAAERNLNRIMLVAAEAQAAAPASKRTPGHKLAADVLGAFALSHAVVGGAWEPAHAVRLSGGALLVNPFGGQL